MRKFKFVIFFLILLGIIFFIVNPYKKNSTPNALLIKASFHELPHWNNDEHSVALAAFQLSCKEWLKRSPEQIYSQLKPSLKAKTWQPSCRAAIALDKANDATAKQFFETWFDPYYVKSTLPNEHLFTGYYLPLLKASITKTKEYSVPIFGLPNDLVKINLAAFNMENKTITGQLKNQQILPYPPRNKINQGTTTAPVLAWTNNEIDLFFAQIQGSAFIELPNKQKRLLSYASGNGQPYTAIGKILIEKKWLNKNEVSMQSIRDQLEKHPDEINDILNQNASYVFFKISKDATPVGNQGVPLTPGRTLAIDRKYIALGTPIWLDTTIPDNDTLKPYQHLMIAQDTGGAIKGAVRGDIYWGTGDKAEFLAGHMQNQGQYWILLPRDE